MGSSIKQRINNLDYLRIAYHILFWVVMNLGYDLFSSYLRNQTFTLEDILIDLIYFTPVQIITVYFTLYFLFPKFLYKKKYYLFTLYFILFFVSTIVLIVLPINYSAYKEYMSNLGKETDVYNFFRYAFFRMANLNLMIMGLAATIKLLRKWLETLKKQRLLEKETLEINLKLQETKIKLIKSQINPNFLFNSLDTLHALTKQKSNLAPEMVLKVSSLLDYMLYDSTSERVEIAREIENIKNYIDLKLANPDNRTQISFEVNGDVLKNEIKPSILLPVIENLFKYASRNMIAKQDFSINLDLDEGTLKLLVLGNFLENVNIEKLKKLYQPVISVLELQYADRYTLIFEKSKKTIDVLLTIQINTTNTKD